MKTFTEYTELLNNTFTKKDVIAPVESSSEASRPYAVGEKFFYNNILYEATDVIASGGIIDPGTNCEEAEDIVSQIENKTIVTDAVPTQGSTNPVQSGGVYDSLATKAELTQISNPNLLDNPWFTVNQRGLTTLSTAGYLFDRWKMVVDIGTMNARENGLEIDATSNAVTLAQQYDTNDSTVKRIFEDDLNEYTYSIDFTVLAKPSGNTLSFTLFSNITGQSGTLKAILSVKPDDVVIGQRYLKSGSSVLGYTIEDSATSLALVWAFFRAGWKIIIHSIKVEKGSISTLAMDTVPDYAEELLKCQRYFFRASATILNGFIFSATVARFNMGNPKMRTNPSITVDDYTLPQIVSNGNSYSLSNDSISSVNTDNGVILYINSVGMPTNEVATLKVNGAVISLSADL